VDLFNSKVGVDLQFRSLQAGAGISLLQKDNNVLVNSTSNQTGLNVGDFDLFKQQILNNLQFRGITAGSGVSLTQYDNNVLINATGGAASTVNYPYDYFIVHNYNNYIAYNGTFDVVSTNTDLDTVWSAVVANYATLDQVFIQFGSGQFVTDTGLSINRNNITLAGLGTGTWFMLDSGAVAGTRMFSIGASISSTTYNIGDENRGAATITTDTAADAGNFAAGDYILVQSNRQIGDETDELQSEHHLVKAAYAGNGTIKLQDDLLENYITIGGASPTVRLSNTMTHNIILKDFVIDDLRTSSTAPNPQGSIYALSTNNLLIDGVFIYNHFWTGIRIANAIDTTITNCKMKNAEGLIDPQFYIQYGIVIQGPSSGSIVQGCTFEDVRHAVTTHGGDRDTIGSGQVRNLIIDGNTARVVSSTCFDTHDSAFGTTISNNACEGGGNNVSDVPTSAYAGSGISARGPVLISGNTIQNVPSGGIRVFQEREQGLLAIPPENSIISDNRIINIGDQGIQLENSTYTIVSGNVIINSTAEGIRSQTLGLVEGYVKIEGNIIKNAGADGIEADHRIDAIGNTIDITGGHGIFLDGIGSTIRTSQSNFRDNNIQYTAQYGIRVNEGNKIVIDGNTFYRTGDGCLAGLTNAQLDLSDSFITNNFCDTPDYPTSGGAASTFLYLEDAIRTVITNNYIKNATASSNCAITLQISAQNNIIKDNYIDGSSCLVNIFAGENLVTDNINLASPSFPQYTPILPKKWGELIPISASADLLGLMGGCTILGTATYVYDVTDNSAAILSTTAVTDGINGGIHCTATDRNVYRGDQNAYMYSKWEENKITTNRIFIGFSSSATHLPNNADDQLNALHGAGLCIDTDEATYRFCHNDGAGATVEDSLTTAEDTGVHFVEIYAYSAGATWCARLDGGTPVCATANIPTATQRMYAQSTGETDGGATAILWTQYALYTQTDK